MNNHKKDRNTTSTFKTNMDLFTLHKMHIPSNFSQPKLKRIQGKYSILSFNDMYKKNGDLHNIQSSTIIVIL